MTRLAKTIAALSATAFLAACGGANDAVTDGRMADVDTTTQTSVPNRKNPNDNGSDTIKMTTGQMKSASFDVMNSSGIAIGEVVITDTSDGVTVSLDVTSIPPGNHAIHFHEVGTCDGPDFKSAGGHYNPAGVNHGFEAEGASPHAGDMRNFNAPQSGVVRRTLRNNRVSLSGRDGMAPLMDANGTALIIHASADDYKSQPSGAAGARIACAVIAP